MHSAATPYVSWGSHLPRQASIERYAATSTNMSSSISLSTVSHAFAPELPSLLAHRIQYASSTNFAHRHSDRHQSCNETENKYAGYLTTVDVPPFAHDIATKSTSWSSTYRYPTLYQRLNERSQKNHAMDIDDRDNREEVPRESSSPTSRWISANTPIAAAAAASSSSTVVQTTIASMQPTPEPTPTGYPSIETLRARPELKDRMPAPALLSQPLIGFVNPKITPIRLDLSLPLIGVKHFHIKTSKDKMIIDPSLSVPMCNVHVGSSDVCIKLHPFGMTLEGLLKFIEFPGTLQHKPAHIDEGVSAMQLIFLCVI